VESPQDPLFVEEEVPVRDLVARRCAVELVTGYTVPVVGGTPSAEGFRSYILEYDKNGSRTRLEKFSSAGELVWRCVYDDEGMPRKEITYTVHGEVDYQFDISYSDGYWKERLMYSAPGRLHYRVVAERDASGRLLRAVFYDAAGLATRSDSYAYDSLGRLMRVDLGNIGQCVYEYDEKRNLIRRSRNLPGASAYGDVTEFEHDGQGLLTRMDHLHFSVTSLSFTFSEVTPG
jgi:hypothetical protein